LTNLNNKNKYSKYILLIFLIYTLIHIPVFIFPSLQGQKIWRQADTAAVARNFAVESMNIFYPRIDLRGNLSGITGMEFPLFNYLVAIVYKITGTTWVNFGKILSYICAVFSVILLAKLVFSPSLISKNYLKENLETNSQINLNNKFCNPALFVLIALLSPFCFRYSAKFMPEFLAMFLSVSSLVLFLSYQGKQDVFVKKSNYLILFSSALLLLLSMLVRPYYAFFGLPLFIRAVLSFYNKKFSESFICIFIGVFVLSVFYAWYGYWVPYLNKSYGMSYFFMGSSIKENFLSLFSTNIIIDLFKEISHRYLGWVFLPFVLHGIYLYIRKDCSDMDNKINIISVRQIVFIGLVSLLIIPFLIGKTRDHIYYYGASYPMLMIFCYLSMQNIADTFPNKKVIVVFSIIFIIVAGVLTPQIYKRHGYIKALVNKRADLLKNVGPNDLIITTDGGIPIDLFVLNRKGWVISLPRNLDERNNMLAHLKSLGAKYMLTPAKGAPNGDFDTLKMIKL